MQWIGGAEGDWHEPSNWEDYEIGDIHIYSVSSPSEEIVITAREPIDYTCDRIVIGDIDCGKVTVIFEEDVKFTINDDVSALFTIVNAEVVHNGKLEICHNYDNSITLFPQTSIKGYDGFLLYTENVDIAKPTLAVYGQCSILNTAKFEIPEGSLEFYSDEGDDEAKSTLHVAGELNLFTLEFYYTNCDVTFSESTAINVEYLTAYLLYYNGEGISNTVKIFLNGCIASIYNMDIQLRSLTDDQEGNKFTINMDGGKLLTNTLEVHYTDNWPVPPSEEFNAYPIFENVENSMIVFMTYRYDRDWWGDVIEYEPEEPEEVGSYFSVITSHSDPVDFLFPDHIEIMGRNTIEINGAVVEIALVESVILRNGGYPAPLSNIWEINAIQDPSKLVLNTREFYAEVTSEDAYTIIASDYDTVLELHVHVENAIKVINLQNCNLSNTKAVAVIGGSPVDGQVFFKALTRNGCVDVVNNEGWIFEESVVFSPITFSEIEKDKAKATVSILEYPPSFSTTIFSTLEAGLSPIPGTSGQMRSYRITNNYYIPFSIQYGKTGSEYSFGLFYNYGTLDDLLSINTMEFPYNERGNTFIADLVYFIYDIAYSEPTDYELVLYEDGIEVDRVLLEIDMSS